MTSSTFKTNSHDKIFRHRKFCVAPMMDWTDRHYRFFLRLISKQTLLYTEMITSGAILNGNRKELLNYNNSEQPLALQVGGSKPSELGLVTKIAQHAGYQEINLNVGCPSNRVQNNMIGACLMNHPLLVSDCIKAMLDSGTIPVSIKHRIGLDGNESYDNLSNFVDLIQKAGCKTFIIHARIAVLNGLSPKQNRDIPPLKYDIVERLKKDFPNLQIIVNGGIKTLEASQKHLKSFDGVMLGREIYKNPYLLSEVDQSIFGEKKSIITRYEILMKLRPYIKNHIDSGGLAQHITRHILGLAHNFSGAKKFRQILSSDIYKASCQLKVFDQACQILKNH